MKTAIATLLAFMLITGTAIAQTVCLSQNSGAIPIDTVTATIALSPSDPYAAPTENYDSTTREGDSGGGYNTKSKSGGVIINIVYWRVGDHVECSISPESIYFTGDSSAIDSKSTQELFDLFAQVAIGQALNYGYATCYTTCGTSTFRVSLPACVERFGRGVNTRFRSCKQGSCCTRVYTICCPEGATTPVIRLMGTEGGGSCAGLGSGACESLCP